MKETPKSILEWSETTFGKMSVPTMVARLNLEMAELIAEVDSLRNCPNERFNELLEKARGECADIYIVLAQIAEKMEINLHERVDQKMEINRNRKWVLAENGMFQHEE